ncbi:MAG: ribosomal-processing cysteine protease Prp [Clostridia bacterium]|nr:ribosomal-processing cysteine protease Prp [Clostridia bacterium]
MIEVRFFTDGELLSGFEISGHSDYADDEQDDIVCASVSSAAYMAANTVTDIIGLAADIRIDDGYMKFQLRGNFSEAQQILKGLRLHLESLAQDYSDYIKVTSLRRCQNA